MLITILACSLFPATDAAVAAPLELASSSEALASLVLQPAALPIGTEGGEFSYTYVELGATQLDLDDDSLTDEDVDSFYLKASLALGMFHIFASYEDQELDFQDTSTDLYTLGAGVHFPVAPKLDVLAEVAWIYNDLTSDISQLDDTTDGWGGRAGVRWMALPWDRGGLELNGNLLYIDLENRLASDDDATTGWDVGTQVHFLKLFSVGAAYAIIDDDDRVSVNARVSF